MSNIQNFPTPFRMTNLNTLILNNATARNIYNGPNQDFKDLILGNYLDDYQAEKHFQPVHEMKLSSEKNQNSNSNNNYFAIDDQNQLTIREDLINHTVSKSISEFCKPYYENTESINILKEIYEKFIRATPSVNLSDDGLKKLENSIPGCKMNLTEIAVKRDQMFEELEYSRYTNYDDEIQQVRDELVLGVLGGLNFHRIEFMYDVVSNKSNSVIED